MNCFYPMDRQACEDLPLMDIQLKANTAHEAQNLTLLRHAAMLQEECKRLLNERQRLQVELDQWRDMAERDRRQMERLQFANEQLQRDLAALLAANKDMSEKLNQSPLRLLLDQLKGWAKAASTERLAS